MADFIEISGLLIRTIVGINPDERVNRQDVVIDLKLGVDTHAAARTDDIVEAMNYRTLTKDVIALVEASSFHLIESLADAISRLCLQEQQVCSAQVRVCKPGAVRFAKSVSVTIERQRHA